MIGEREPVTTKVNPAPSLVPKGKPGMGAGVKVAAPRVPEAGALPEVSGETTAAPRVPEGGALPGASDEPIAAPAVTPRGHRFQEIAVLPGEPARKIEQKAPAFLPYKPEPAGAPAQSDKDAKKQAPPAVEKKRIQSITFNLKTNVVTFTYENGSPDTTTATYNGRPEPKVYEIQVMLGEPVTWVESGVSQDGYVVKWETPPGATLEGVSSYQFIVITGEPAAGTKEKPDKEKAKEDGGTGGEVKTKPVPDQKDAAPAAKAPGTAKKGEGPAKDGEGTGVLPEGKNKDATAPTTQPSTQSATQAGSQPASQPAAQPTSTPASQPTVAEGKGDAKAVYELLDSLRPDIRDLLTGPDGQMPTDLDKLKQVVKELETLSPEEIELFQKATKARTNDLDLFLQTVNAFKALSPEEKKFAAMSKQDKLIAAKKQVIEASGAALKDAFAHPFRTAYQMTIGQLGFGGESFGKAKEDFEKAKHSSGKGKEGFFFGGASKMLMGISQTTLTLGLILGAPLLLFGAPAVLVGSLAAAGVIGLAALFAQAHAGMKHLDAAAQAPTLEQFKTHSQAASEEFASLALVPVGMVLLSGILWGLKKGYAGFSSAKGAKQATALDAYVEEANAKIASDIAAVDAQMAAAKKPKPAVPDLKNVPPEINAIWKKQEWATAAEKKQLKEYTEQLMRDAATKTPDVPDKDFRKLLAFEGITEVSVGAFKSKAEITAAVEKALSEAPDREVAASLEQATSRVPDAMGEAPRTIRGQDILRALESQPDNKANQSVLRVIRDIFKTQESPQAYAKMVGEIWERAKKIYETQKARIEEMGRSPFTLAMIDLLVKRGVSIELVKDLLPAETFGTKILEPGATLLDLKFEDASHGITPHMLEYLVLDDMLKGLEPPTTMKQFLLDLSQVRGAEGLGGDIWILLLDASPESMRSPEFFMAVLRGLIPELE